MILLARIKHVLARFFPLIEFCHRCGRRQPLVWWCESNKLWRHVTRFTEDGEGIVCPKCFDKMAEKKGIIIRWLATEETDLEDAQKALTEEGPRISVDEMWKNLIS